MITEDILDQLCAQASEEDGGEWHHDGDIFGMDFTFTCPCGDSIEPDGTCSEGHVAPMRRYRLL